MCALFVGLPNGDVSLCIIFRASALRLMPSGISNFAAARGLAGFRMPQAQGQKLQKLMQRVIAGEQPHK